MASAVSVLAVREDEEEGFRFGLATFSHAELDEPALMVALERWLWEASEVVTIGGGDIGPTLLALAVARGAKPCPHVVALAMPQPRNSWLTLLLDEVCEAGAAPSTTLDELVPALDLPSMSDDPNPKEDKWVALKRKGEIEAVAMWLTLAAWRSAWAGDVDTIPLAMRALETWLFHSMENLRHLASFGSGDRPHVPSAPLAPSGVLVF